MHNVPLYFAPPYGQVTLRGLVCDQCCRYSWSDKGAAAAPGCCCWAPGMSWVTALSESVCVWMWSDPFADISHWWCCTRESRSRRCGLLQVPRTVQSAFQCRLS